MTFPATETRLTGLAVALMAMVLAGAGLFSGAAHGQRTVSSDLAVRELKAALEIAQKQLAAAKQKDAALDAKNEALTESLAESNRVLTALRAEHEELLLRMASFGVDLLKPDPKSLEQRLLNTVRERDVVEREKEKIARQLLRLSEATVSFLQTAVSPDEAGRQLIQRELSESSRVLGPATATGREPNRALAEGRVVSIDPEIGLVVLNVGESSGARVGMPLRILREQTLIGTAMVVDVRDSITGAVLQRIATEGKDVKVGDRIEPEAR